MSQQINLFNPLFLKQEKYFSARAMLQALGMIALGLAGLYAVALVQAREGEHAARESKAQVALAREQFAKISASLSPEVRSKALEIELARLEADVAARRPVIAALAIGELGNTAGFSGYFAAFGRKTMPGVWLTGFGVGEGGKDLKVLGRVLHPDLVPAYLRALNDESAMRGRQITELTLTAKDTSAAPRPATTATGAPAPAKPGAPERFVEFSFTAQLRGTETAPSAPKPKPQRGGS